MGRKSAVALVVVGMMIGFRAAQYVPESVVNAQTGWQCQSWTFQKGREQAPAMRAEQENMAAVGAWLGQARTVQISAAGLDVAGLYALVACKQ